MMIFTDMTDKQLKDSNDIREAFYETVANNNMHGALIMFISPFDIVEHRSIFSESSLECEMWLDMVTKFYVDHDFAYLTCVA